MEQIKELLEKRGFKRICIGHGINGSETHNYVNLDTLE